MRSRRASGARLEQWIRERALETSQEAGEEGVVRVEGGLLERGLVELAPEHSGAPQVGAALGGVAHGADAPPARAGAPAVGQRPLGCPLALPHPAGGVALGLRQFGHRGVDPRHVIGHLRLGGGRQEEGECDEQERERHVTP